MAEKWFLFLSVRNIMAIYISSWIKGDNLPTRIKRKKRNFRHDNCIKIIENLTRKLCVMENIVDIGNEGKLTGRKYARRGVG